MHQSLSVPASGEQRRAHYETLRERIESLLEDETDPVAAMSTVVCELHHGFDYFDWTGFYRVVEPETLAVGPYQGTHGCLRIPFSRGVCGAAARTGRTQLVDDVHARDDHIACSSTTESEIVVPVQTSDDELLAVLDIDSDTPAAFNQADREALEQLCAWFGRRYGSV